MYTPTAGRPPRTPPRTPQRGRRSPARTPVAGLPHAGVSPAPPPGDAGRLRRRGAAALVAALGSGAGPTRPPGPRGELRRRPLCVGALAYEPSTRLGKVGLTAAPVRPTHGTLLAAFKAFIEGLVSSARNLLVSAMGPIPARWPARPPWPTTSRCRPTAACGRAAAPVGGRRRAHAAQGLRCRARRGYAPTLLDCHHPAGYALLAAAARRGRRRRPRPRLDRFTGAGGVLPLHHVYGPLEGAITRSSGR